MGPLFDLDTTAVFVNPSAWPFKCLLIADGILATNV